MAAATATLSPYASSFSSLHNNNNNSNNNNIIEIQALVRLDNAKTHLLNFSYTPSYTDDEKEDVKLKHEILHHLSLRTNYPPYALRLHPTQTPFLPPPLQTPQVLHLTAKTHLPLLGGKGGFGTLLKGQSKRAGAKTTLDFGACRDLSGRRLRHVNDEIKLRKWRSAQYRRANNLPIDEVEELKTVSGIRNWHLSVPSWSDVGGNLGSNKGKRKAERSLEKEVFRWKSEEERMKEKRRRKEEEEERRVEDYVREVNVRLEDDDNDNMMDAIKMGMMAQQQKKILEKEQKTMEQQKLQANNKKEYQHDENVESNQPNYLCTLSGEAVILDDDDDAKYTQPPPQKTKHAKNEITVQSQAEFTTFAILLSQPISIYKNSSSSSCLSNKNKSIYYYEVTIHSMGLSQIGWALSSSSSSTTKEEEEDTIEFNPNSDVGDGVGDDKYSYGYDASRSLCFHNGIETPYGSSSGGVNDEEEEEKKEWKKGDVLGCTYNAGTGCISYRLNGKDLGVAFDLLRHERKRDNGDDEDFVLLYPALSLNHGVIVTINVGPVFEYCFKGEEGMEEDVVGICKLIGDDDEDGNEKKKVVNKEEEEENEKKSGGDGKTKETKDEKSSGAEQDVTKSSSQQSSDPLNTAKEQQKQKPSKSEAKEKKEEKPFDWDDYDNASQLELLGMERLKSILLDLGVKCGGSLQERAKRLFSLKGLKREDYPKKVRGKNFVV